MQSWLHSGDTSFKTEPWQLPTRFSYPLRFLRNVAWKRRQSLRKNFWRKIRIKKLRNIHFPSPTFSFLSLTPKIPLNTIFSDTFYPWFPFNGRHLNFTHRHLGTEARKDSELLAHGSKHSTDSVCSQLLNEYNLASSIYLHNRVLEYLSEAICLSTWTSFLWTR